MPAQHLSPQQRITRIKRKAGKVRSLERQLTIAREELDGELAGAANAGAPIAALMRAASLHRNTVLKAIDRAGGRITSHERWAGKQEPPRDM